MTEFTNNNTPLDKTNNQEEVNRVINKWRNFNDGGRDHLYGRNDASILPTPFGNISYSDAFFDLMKNWLIDINKTWIKAINSYEYPDLRIFLPRAFFINWSDPKVRENELFNPTIWIPSLYTSKEDQDKLMQQPFKLICDLFVGGNYVGGNYAGRDYAEGNIHRNI